MSRETREAIEGLRKVTKPSGRYGTCPSCYNHFIECRCEDWNAALDAVLALLPAASRPAANAGYSDSRTDDERARDAKVITTLTVSHPAASAEEPVSLHPSQDDGSEPFPCRHGSTVCEECAYDRGFADGQQAPAASEGRGEREVAEMEIEDAIVARLIGEEWTRKETACIRRAIRYARALPVAAGAGGREVTEEMVEAGAKVLAIIPNGLTEKGWRNEDGDKRIEEAKAECRKASRDVLRAALSPSPDAGGVGGN